MSLQSGISAKIQKILTAFSVLSTESLFTHSTVYFFTFDPQTTKYISTLNVLLCRENRNKGRENYLRELDKGIIPVNEQVKLF